MMRDGQRPPTGEMQDISELYHRALRRHRPVLLGVLGLSGLINLLALTGSLYMLQVYDRVLSSRSMETLAGLFAIVVVLYGFYTLFTALRARFLSRAAFGLDAELAGPAFGIGVEAARQDVADAGAAGATGDLTILRRFVSGSGFVALLDLPFMPIFVTVLFILHPWLGWLTIGGAILAALIALLNRAVTRRAAGDIQRRDRAEATFAAQSRDSGEMIVAMGLTRAVTRRWAALRAAALASTQSSGDPSEVLASISRGFRMLLQSAILTLGAILVLRGEISPGMIIAASILSGRALAPVDQLIGHWRGIGQGIAAHRRLAATFAAAEPRAPGIDLPDPVGQVTVRNLTKLAPGATGIDPPRILSGVSFSLRPGDGLGVVGDSASGKTTLARLLVGAGLADAGEVRLEGATLEQWPAERRGRIVGYLPQSLSFLPGTIRENIARFDPDATDEAIIDAAMLTGIHDMILKLPQGYATRIGDPDAPPVLSGGQMQRLGLARAVYGMPPLVVLDEPNSNLDIAGDAALTRTIAALRKSGTTVIVMAHRPSALEAVNKLMVLHDGEVRVFGDKAEVLADPVSRAANTDGRVVAMHAPTTATTPSEPQTPGRRKPAVVRQAGPRRERRPA